MTHYHFIGIGGIGMSALAHILLDKGCKVSGRDKAASKILSDLKQKGAVIVGDLSPLEEDVTALVYSTAVSDSHPCMQEASKRNIPKMHRSALLHLLMQGHKPLLVAGTHGKTTTSSLLAHVLQTVGFSSCYAVGGIIKNVHKNGAFGEGEYFVAESDESDGSFLTYSPWGGIVTNIDNDHLDYWKTPEELIEGFKKYLEQHECPKELFWCIDNDNLKSLSPKGTSYGFSEEADLVIKSFSQEGWQSCFDITFENKEYSNILLPLIGGHNVLNAAAVFGLCLRLGIAEEEIRAALYTFQGIERRADNKGSWNTIPFYDDYGHHPTEILATLRGVRAACPENRVVVVFQPHRYTRTRDCLEDFKEAFHAADLLIVTDIYSAGEKPIEGVNSELLIDKIKQGFSKPLHLCNRKELAGFLKTVLKQGDVVLTLGAGDITFLSQEVFA